MGLNSPIPVRLEEETAKAAKIVRKFVDVNNNGLDKVIPRSVLERAQGFAIFTVVKAGFVVSARAGSGVVIARLEDGSWSAPSAIGLGGFGGGFQMGAEITDFLVVLNSRSAVKSFMTAGSLNIGGNLSIAVGPLGRNAEGTGAINSKGGVAAMYSYSKTKGLFGGVSLEGSVIVERADANRMAYGGSVSVKQILSGQVDAPQWAAVLTDQISRSVGNPRVSGWKSDEAGEGGGMGWDAPNDNDYSDAGDGYGGGGGRNRKGSTSTSGYIFGEGIGGQGSTSPQAARTPPGGRSRASSLLKRGGDDADRLAGPSASRPVPAYKRSSSFTSNPFKSGEKIPSRVQSSSESYNAGLTWDSDGPINGGNRSRAGSNPQRPSGLSYSPQLDGPVFKADRFSSYSEDGAAGSASGSRSRGTSISSPARGGLDTYDTNGTGLASQFAQMKVNGATNGTRSRSNSKPPLFQGIPEDDYAPHESVSAYAQQKLSSAGSFSPSQRYDSPTKSGRGSVGAGSAHVYGARDVGPAGPQGSPFGDGSTERFPFNDYASSALGPGPSPNSPPLLQRTPDRRSSLGPKPALALKTGLDGDADGRARAVALFDFGASHPDDLGLKKGQIVWVLKSVGAGEWWEGRAAGGVDGSKTGIFPRDYVEVIELPKDLKPGISRTELKKRVFDLGFD